jgi:hypothetical protein
MAEIKSESVADFIPESVADFPRNTHFSVGTIEVEFNVAVKRDGGPNGKVKFEVFGIGAELGGDAKFARESSQKIRLTLTPHKINLNGTLGELDIAKPLQPEKTSDS